MFSHLRYLLAAMAVGLCIPSATRADDIRAKLVKSVDFDKAIEAPLKDVLEFLSDRFDLKIQIDVAAFKEENHDNPGEMRISLPILRNAFLDTCLRDALVQIGAVYEIHPNGLVILPKMDHRKERRFPRLAVDADETTKPLREKISKKQLELPADIAVTLKEFVELLSDQYNLAVIIDPVERKKMEMERVQIKKGTYTFQDALGQALERVKATYSIEADHVRIVRQKPKT
jgi:hypothetical protein